ncbi:MAG TPA: ester cyclase [bacterium]|nr:ester cyclase [bacterium]
MRKTLVLALGLGLVASGLAFAKDMKSPVDANKEKLKGFYKDVMNAHNPDAVGDYCTEKFVDHNPDPDQKQGMEGLKAAFKGLFTAFPDLHVTVEQVAAEGDLAIARITMSGTQKGDYMGMPASGKKFKIGGIDIVKIKDGKATDRWGYGDSMAMMRQLGCDPSKKKDACCMMGDKDKKKEKKTEKSEKK